MPQGKRLMILGFGIKFRDSYFYFPLCINATIMGLADFKSLEKSGVLRLLLSEKQKKQ